MLFEVISRMGCRDFRIQEDAVQVAVIRYNSRVDRKSQVKGNSYEIEALTIE